MKHADGFTVAVTGASGYLGTRLIRTLCSDERIDRVLGFDLGPPQFKSDKFIFDVVDVRDRRLSSRLSDVDVIVHLASVMDPIHDEAVMRDINVNGSQNVFIAAADAGVGKIVYSSSATVYGAHPDNDVPLTEESPLRANLDFSYAAHKLEVEYVVKEFRAEHPSVIFTLLRPAIVFGAGVHNAWSHFMEAPCCLGSKVIRHRGSACTRTMSPRVPRSRYSTTSTAPITSRRAAGSRTTRPPSSSEGAARNSQSRRRSR